MKKRKKPVKVAAPESFSTTLSAEAKGALTLFCKRRGLRINHFLEELIWDRLEDEIDTEIANSEVESELVDLDDLRNSAA